MIRILADAALPPELQVLESAQRHPFLILGIVALVAAAAVVLVIVLKKKKGKK
ncbi:MAG: hypothetical protein IKD54_04925 [Clostridia bacterium]|jgi:hypothetical protein|nr:hypothetical protein [Clostridia bacterium]MBR2644615.1 hypothetical protein [Clostridia bacterium]MBR3130654.1 hypothetical protein [Clostridia bacterium]